MKNINEELKVGDEINLHIVKLGTQGDGMARRPNGLVIFVKGSKVGEKFRARIITLADSYAFAQKI